MMPGLSRVAGCPGLALVVVSVTLFGSMGCRPKTDTAAVAPPAAASTPVPASPATRPDPALATLDGAALYQQHCATCHMADGSGVPNMQPSLLDSAFAQNEPEVLARIVLLGSRILQRPAYQNEMPGFTALSDAEIAAISNYVRAGFVKQPPNVTPAHVASVRAESR